MTGLAERRIAAVEPYKIAAFPVAIAGVVISLVLTIFSLAGPSYAVVALGFVSLPYVFLRPQRALWSATAFMLLALTIAPQSLRVPGEDTPPEYYSYAVGLFLISLPLALRLPWRRLLSSLRNRGATNAPLALIAFLFVSFAAALQGLRLGFELSYIVRQFYGALLFYMYFWATLHFTRQRDEIAEIMRRLKWIGLAACVLVTPFYLGIRDEVGIFKRNLSVYAAVFAAYSLGEFLYARGLRARLGLAFQFLVFTAHASLFRSRGAVGILGAVALLGFGLLLPSRKTKLVAFLGTGAILALGITANLFAPLSKSMPEIGGAAELIPEDVLSDPSFYSRMDQLLSAIDVVKAHPLLGLGVGSELTFFDPRLNDWGSYAFVDQGYAYLLSKFGLLGLLVFTWLLSGVARKSGWPERQGMHLGLFLVFVFHILYMLNAPIMLHLIFSPWVGITCGFLYQLRSLPLDSLSQAPRPMKLKVPISKGGLEGVPASA